MRIELNRNEALNVVKAMHDVAIELGWEEDELEECGVLAEYGAVVDAAMRAMGFELTVNPTEVIEEEEDEEDFDFDFDDEEEEEEDDTTQYTLTVKGDFVLRYMNAGHSFEEACQIADILFGDGE